MSTHKDKGKDPSELKKLDLSYYVTLFKIEGHTTFRMHSSASKDGFEQQVAAFTKAPITEKKEFRIDRVTGAIKQLS